MERRVDGERRANRPKGAPEGARATDLATAVANLACDAVRIQERLDEAAEEAEERFVRLLASVPEGARPHAMAIAPARQVVTEHRVRCAVHAGSSRAGEARLLVAPVRLGLSALYGEQRRSTSTLEVQVVRVPARAAATPSPPENTE